jgi:hypothetical protein
MAEQKITEYLTNDDNTVRYVLTNNVKRVITLLLYCSNTGVTRTKAFCRIAGRLFVILGLYTGAQGRLLQAARAWHSEQEQNHLLHE